MKRIFRLILTVSVIMCLFSTHTYAATQTGTGSCGTDVKWTIYDTDNDSRGDKLVISGKGEMTDYNYQIVPWLLQSLRIKTVVVEKGVTSVGDNAFSGLQNVTSITLPEGLVKIGNSAFSYCANVDNITIPSSVKTIGNSAFNGCRAITKAEIPNGVTSIADSVFSGCTALVNVKIPKTVTEIGSLSFSGCTSLETVTLPQKLKSIGMSAFSGCSSLSALTIPESVETIGATAFYGCKALKKIEIPEGVKAIETETFDGCSELTTVVIPKTVTSVGTRAFTGCEKLKNVYFTGSKTQWAAVTVATGNEKLTGAKVVCDYKKVKITTQPQSVIVSPNKTAKVTVKASGDGLKYTWYYKDAGAAKFSKTNTFKGASYSVKMNAVRNGRQIYCVVTDKYGNSVKSNVVTLSMKTTALQITTQPQNVTARKGKTVKITIAASGDGLKYTWYYKDAGATKFSKTNTFRGTSYSVVMNAARNGRQIYCVVSDAHGNSIKSEVVTLTMQGALNITALPKDVTVSAGKTAKVTVKASGEGLKYAWYYKDAGASKFVKTNSFKSNAYSVKMNTARNGRQVYCVITDKYGNSVKTNTVTLKMK